MKMLNDILRGLMKRSSEVGTVHTGEKLVETVLSKTTVEIAELIVPAGTYLIVANQEWGITSTADTTFCVRVASHSLAIQRGTMSGGGGDSLMAVETFDEKTRIYATTYHSHAEPVGIRVKLQAVKIK